MRGSVAMKISPIEGHVCLGEGEVTKGERVTIYRNVCSTPPGAAKPTERRCQKVAVGHGVVSEILNAHYSVVRLSDGELDEGDTVEPVR